MHIFAPDNLPGVGMGSALSVVGMGGLVGLGVTSGAMLAEGLAGILVWEAAGVAALEAKPADLGGRPTAVVILLVALALVGAVRLILSRRATPPAGLIRALDLVAVLTGSAIAGFAWAEWNETPFTLGDAESFIGAGAGLVAGAIGGHAASLFTEGSVSAGGSRAIVATTVIVTALVANALAVYVPFAGFVVLGVALVFAVRLTRRKREKYKGLRILT